ncbi:TetR/AcrR family transcriptional regulator [Aliterella atlantica]|uniref:HTH tetR-type domain-containing protein n=1 Tax=Aliterella atlantica CENA595 TaxID=1618023 RepID=A0A0D8ZWT7_9CYAN|nr:TetR/AcrR family transcriptional regulator [Aliterella atlantica]KJH72914.1 hypothetical protein UH38_05110 [Aliterella atlantica CENA595]
MGRPVKEKTLSQQDIINAAIACLEQEGELALGVHRVAREIGIKPPSIYKHFDGNAALKEAVTLEIWRRFISHYRRAATGIDEPEEQLHQIGYAIRDFARQHPILWRVMAQVRVDASVDAFKNIVHEIASFYTSALRSYSFNADELVDAIRIFHAAVYGFIQAESSGMFVLSRPTTASFDVMLSVMTEALNALATRNQP